MTSTDTQSTDTPPDGARADDAQPDREESGASPFWRKSRFWLLLLGVAILAAAIVGIVWFVVRDDDDRGDVIGVRGRTIEIHATRPTIVESVTYTGEGGEFRTLRPSASNRQLAAVEVTVVNRTSTVMPLLVDPEAARLGDRRGERIPAMDPFDRYRVAESPGEDLDKYSPLLWGDIQLDRDFQVKGWVIFDVPKGLTLGTIWWDEVDEVVADYVQYTRR